MDKLRLNQLRYINIRVADGVVIPDLTMRPENSSILINGKNGIGKTTLLHLTLQPICPGIVFDKERELSYYFKGRNVSHIMLEFSKDAGGKRKVLVGITIRKHPNPKDKKGIQYYNWLIEYDSNHPMSINKVDPTKSVEGKLLYKTFDEFKSYLEENKASVYRDYYDKQKAFREALEDVHIFQEEWELAAAINGEEGDISEFFGNADDSQKLILNKLLPIVIEAVDIMQSPGENRKAKKKKERKYMDLSNKEVNSLIALPEKERQLDAIGNFMDDISCIRIKLEDYCSAYQDVKAVEARVLGLLNCVQDRMSATQTDIKQKKKDLEGFEREILQLNWQIESFPIIRKRQELDVMKKEKEQLASKIQAVTKQVKDLDLLIRQSKAKAFFNEKTELLKQLAALETTLDTKNESRQEIIKRYQVILSSLVSLLAEKEGVAKERRETTSDQKSMLEDNKTNMESKLDLLQEELDILNKEIAIFDQIISKFKSFSAQLNPSISKSDFLRLGTDGLLAHKKNERTTLAENVMVWKGLIKTNKSQAKDLRAKEQKLYNQLVELKNELNNKQSLLDRYQNDFSKTGPWLNTLGCELDDMYDGSMFDKLNEKIEYYFVKKRSEELKRAEYNLKHKLIIDKDYMIADNALIDVEQKLRDHQLRGVTTGSKYLAGQNQNERELLLQLFPLLPFAILVASRDNVDFIIKNALLDDLDYDFPVFLSSQEFLREIRQYWAANKQQPVDSFVKGFELVASYDKYFNTSAFELFKGNIDEAMNRCDELIQTFNEEIEKYKAQHLQVKNFVKEYPLNFKPALELEMASIEKARNDKDKQLRKCQEKSGELERVNEDLAKKVDISHTKDRQLEKAIEWLLEYQRKQKACTQAQSDKRQAEASVKDKKSRQDSIKVRLKTLAVKIIEVSQKATDIDRELKQIETEIRTHQKNPYYKANSPSLVQLDETELRGRYQQLKFDINHSDNETKDAEHGIEALKESLSSLNDKIKSLDVDKGRINEFNDVSSIQLTEWENTLKTLGKAEQQLKDQINNKQADIQSKQAEITTSKNNLLHNHPEVNEVYADFVTLENSTLKELEGELKTWEELASKLSEDVDSLKEELDRLNIMLVRMESLQNSIDVSRVMPITDELTLDELEKLRVELDKKIKQAVDLLKERKLKLAKQYRKVTSSYHQATIGGIRETISNFSRWLVEDSDKLYDKDFIFSKFDRFDNAFKQLQTKTQTEYQRLDEILEFIAEQGALYMGFVRDKFATMEKLTRIKVEDSYRAKETVRIDLKPRYGSLEGKDQQRATKQHLRSYIKESIKLIAEESKLAQSKGEILSDNAIKRMIEQKLSPAQLFQQIYDVHNSTVEIHKFVDIKSGRKSTGYMTWKEAQAWSGGEKISAQFAVYIMLLSFMRQEVLGREDNASIVLADNPFEKMNADHLLDPFIMLLEKTGVQLVGFIPSSQYDIVKQFSYIVTLRSEHKINRDGFIAVVADDNSEVFIDHNEIRTTEQMKMFG